MQVPTDNLKHYFVGLSEGKQFPKFSSQECHINTSCVPVITGDTKVEQAVIALDYDSVGKKAVTELDINHFLTFIVSDVLGGLVPPEYLTIVRTGHGFHVWFNLSFKINAEDLTQLKKSFNSRPNYHCPKTDIKLLLDINSLNPRTFLRLPHSLYTKGKLNFVTPIEHIGLEELSKDMVQDLKNLVSKSENEFEKKSGQVVARAYDIRGIIEGCSFVKWSYENQSEVSETQWFYLLSILKQGCGEREDIGRRYAHAYSEKHPKYKKADTNRKFDRSGGSPSCESVGLTSDKCLSCPSYKKVRSPVDIVSSDFIKTANTGFRILSKNKEGQVVPGKISYEDLIKAYGAKNQYCVDPKRRELFTYCSDKEHENYGLWSETLKHDVQKYVYDKVMPPPTAKQCEELYSLILLTNNVDFEQFGTTKKLGLLNGCFDLELKTLTPHCPENKIFNKLPFDYDPDALCPQFETFLSSYMRDDPLQIEALKRYTGYTLTLDSSRGMALLVKGGGGNGKSTYNEVLMGLIGERNYHITTVSGLLDKNNIPHLDNKLVLFIEDMGKNLRTSSLDVLKKIITGQRLLGRFLNRDFKKIKPRCKVIIDTNYGINSEDTFDASISRRILSLVPRDKVPHAEVDRHLSTKLLTERAGIFNMALKALARLDKEDEFIDEAQRERLTTQMLHEKAAEKAFLEATVIYCKGREHTISRGRLFNLFKVFIEENQYFHSRYTNSEEFGVRVSKIWRSQLTSDKQFSSKDFICHARLISEGKLSVVSSPPTGGNPERVIL